ncbi:MAG: DUF4861 family protein [Paludibacteraceae bacterium]
MKKIIFSLFSVLLMVACSTGSKVEIVITNSSGLDRNGEMVELSRDTLVKKLGLQKGSTFVITDASSKAIPYQIAYNPYSETDSLVIFPVYVDADAVAIYKVKKGVPAHVEPKVYGRLVPERKDDFTWENDKVAFRVYGPALQATGEISSGIDVWAKRTDKLIVNKWYADELAGKSSYHTDSGEGLDFYKVGPTLGAGATAPYIKDSIWCSQNFTSYEILDNGPLRLTVRFHYAPYLADQVEITPTRVISIDAGAQMNKVTVNYQFAAEELRVASGLVMRNLPGEATNIDENSAYATYKEPDDSTNGTLYTGIVGTKPFTSVEVKNRHILGFQTIKSDASYVYFAGAGWSKSGFDTFEDWNSYVKDFSVKVNTPLKVEFR